MAESLDELKQKAALAHRVLAMTGSMNDTTGHVFVRTPGTNEMLARCRNPKDWSPRYVEAAAMHRANFDGQPTEELGDWVLPPERYIGTELFQMRPDINCVIHSHPPAQVLCTNANVAIRPIVGSQNWGGTLLAVKGVPVYPRSLLIHTPALGRAMAAIMGPRDLVLLQAHGNVVVGRTIEEATVRSIQIENLARLCWQVALSGKEAPMIPWEDFEDNAQMTEVLAADIPSSGTNLMWSYYVELLKHGRRIDDRMDPE